MITAVILAADRPEPSGKAPLLQPLRGKPILQWLLESAVKSELTEVVCVVRDLVQLRPHIALTHEKLFWLVDYGADRGAAHALNAGLWSVDPRSDGVMFVRGNQPQVSPTLIDTLIERFSKSNGWIVAPAFAGEPRSPMLFHRELFPELIKLTGDQQERTVLDQYRNNTDLIAWDEAAPLVEPNALAAIETPKELA